ncbi:internal scaffolding protein [Apis mellifera associated microvirus 32]|nr:internal scaffolding protein [Apis mellifera associated microvirus 32]
MSKRKIRSAYSGQVHCLHPVSGEPTRVKQEFKKEVNINTIINRMKNGISPPAWMTSRTPRYGDFTGMPVNFQDAFAVVEKARQAFEALPLEFRRALDHDPRNLDQAPRELFERFGLLKSPPDGTSAAPKGPASPPSGSPAVGGNKAASAASKGSKQTPPAAEGED